MYASAGAKQMVVVQKLEETLMRQQNSKGGPNMDPEHTITSAKYKRLHCRNKQLHAKLAKMSRSSSKGGSDARVTTSDQIADPVKAELLRIVAENERLAEANMISRTGGVMMDEVCLRWLSVLLPLLYIFVFVVCPCCGVLIGTY